ncbi:MAG TPA: hypothetical protein DDZ39_05350 [Flavobacteriaceae bacterium]|jgi:hypothetical protein|nr:hypothetical protein [Flavobacteriaceae bacterium]HBS12489.1 hypothetical protein [Flavobacteriaceae bacterium]
MKKQLIEESTYVLFGGEAIQIYGLSINMLMSSTQLVYKVASYNEVSAFVTESKKWDDFMEIKEKDYILLKNHLSKSPPLGILNKQKRNKKPVFFNFFK